MVVSTEVKTDTIDVEWAALILEALYLEIPKEEIIAFLKNTKKD